MITEFLTIAPHISEALLDRRPVLALESTVISHGLPYPENLETARALEAAAREEGAEPATVVILDGKLVIGASEEELERIARAEKVNKLNLSNLAVGVASGQPGSTTVAATMFAAHHAGIQVFATGGIGGVHRGVAATFDVSADIGAFARFPVAVVSSGAKAILDLPKTVETLETVGVPVFGWQTDEFPAFYRRSSGLRLDWRFDDLEDLARAVRANWALGVGAGILVANPVPREHELDKEIYEEAMAQALTAARNGRTRGRDVTPVLLAAMREATAGQSVFTNQALLESNVRLGARLAGRLDS